jgi:hypothetical protein
MRLENVFKHDLVCSDIGFYVTLPLSDTTYVNIHTVVWRRIVSNITLSGDK